MYLLNYHFAKAAKLKRGCSFVGAYSIWCGVNRLGDSDVHYSAVLQLLLIRRVRYCYHGVERPEWMASA